MDKPLTTQICFLFLALSLISTTLLASQLAGSWVGIWDTVSTPTPLRLHLAEEEGKWTGTLSIPTQQIMNVPVIVTLENGKIAFTLERESGPVEFRAVYETDRLSGTVRSGDQEAAFQMARLADIETEKYFGIYRKGPEDFVYVRTWDELGENQLAFLTDSGRVGPLFARSSQTFFTGPSLWVPLPEEDQFEFVEQQGKMDGLAITTKGNNTEKAKKVEIVREEEIRFQSGGVYLSGSIVAPADGGPHPLIVLVHGSGPVTRDFLGPFPYLLARHGIAALTYDKRGIGKSEGHWLDADFETLAGDAIAAVQAAKTRPGIDPKRIGMFGISQGGWILPLAANRSDDIAFLILASAAAVTPAEQQLMLMRQEMSLAGASEEQIGQGVAETRAQFDELRAEETRQYLQGEVEKLEKEGKTDLLKTRGLENPKFLLHYRSILDFDSAPYLEKVKCPVLVIYGELDRLVPVKENREKLEAALRKGGNHDVTVRILPGADHALLLSSTGSMSEFPYLSRFAPEFFPTVIQWTLSRPNP